MYTIRMYSDIAEAQIDDLSDAEIDVLLKIYEVLRLTPDNGRKLGPTGNMYVWDYKGISVTYVLLDPQREVAVLRVETRSRRPAAIPATVSRSNSSPIVLARRWCLIGAMRSRRYTRVRGAVGFSETGWRVMDQVSSVFLRREL